MSWLHDICVSCWTFLAEFWHWFAYVFGSIFTALAVYYGQMYARRGIAKARKAFHAIIGMTDDISEIRKDLAELKSANTAEHGKLAEQVKDLGELQNEADNKISELSGQLKMFALLKKE
jgi:hypothetical protein